MACGNIICSKYGLLATNRCKKFPNDYYVKQKENNENLPKNILNRNFISAAPLKKNGIRQSMSRRGNCWDNACNERFFGTLKVESGFNDLLKTGLLSYKKIEELIDNFINYYNNERIQKNLAGKLPPSAQNKMSKKMRAVHLDLGVWVIGNLIV